MIEFYDTETELSIDNSNDIYFIRGDGTVWCDTGEYWESQQASIGFEDCVKQCKKIGWRIVPNA